mgnify:FL=1|tara:strand:+ start:85 stop:498 length:414 start_codon:yes stop_codon:yes gene_type:complete
MRQYYKKGKKVEKKKSGKKFPDLTGDGKVTRADVLKGRGVFKRGGDVSKRTSPKKGESHRDKMKRNEKFDRIAEEGREKIRTRRGFRTGGDTHVTKEGKTAKKGLWYNIHQKRKRGEKMRKKGAKGAPTAEAIKKSQ